MANDRPEQVELQAVIREVQERVRARYPMHTAGSAQIVLPDLMPVVHARDRAESKVAAIGSVNPRPAGLVNNVIQGVKRNISRALGWFVRDQIEFNRASMDCVQSLMEAMNENRRSLSALAALIDQRHAELRNELHSEVERLERDMKPVQRKADALQDEARELKDVRVHWAEWRKEWERKLSINEVQFLRSVADLQSAFQHRATLMESNFRDLAGSYHKDFTGALDRARLDIQERLWDDLAKIRAEYEKLIHNELRVMRQRASAQPAPVIVQGASAATDAATQSTVEFDSLRFSDRFRGTEEYVRTQLQHYVAKFEGGREVLDIGCGRGEFLQCLREAGFDARGVESSEELTAMCRAKGLAVEKADLFAYLSAQPAASLDGIFCGQVVEHLPLARIPELIRLSAEVLRPGGKLVMETPNPECLAIFATHFYLDPTHVRPVPAPLLAFYLEEHGFGQITVEYLNPASETMPSVSQLPEVFRHAFFGGLDYAITGRRL